MWRQFGAARQEGFDVARPNIVLIMADQLAPHFTGAYGHRSAQTPHLDALARRGMRFDAAYCNSPLCAPSRCSFMSGQLVSRIKTYDNASEFPASVPTFAHYLNALGYRTCLSGKMHFVGPDQLLGFAERLTTDVYPADFAWTPDWQKPEERIDKWYHNIGSVKNSGTALASYQIDYDEEVGFAARRWLTDMARNRAQGDDTPFLLVASFIHPHDPFVALPDWWDRYSDDDIDLPSPAPDPLDPHSERVAQGTQVSDISVSDEDIRRTRRAYLANVSYFDSKIGEIAKTLEDTGMMDDTIFIVTSDHGEMLGTRGLWFKMTFFEQSARVPLVVAGPGIAQGQSDVVCSLVDMLPTFLDLAGGADMPLGAPIDGRSLLPAMQGHKTTQGEALGEYCAEMAAAPIFMIRRGRFKYIHCDVDPPMLFDLQTDPEELRNLAGEAEFDDIAAAFAAEVRDRWDSAKLRQDVMKSQQARHVLHAAMQAGPRQDWDYNPPRDASQQYVRNHMDWDLAEQRYRFPPLKP
jgi:choline-sulfatase